MPISPNRQGLGFACPVERSLEYVPAFLSCYSLLDCCLSPDPFHALEHGVEAWGWCRCFTLILFPMTEPGYNPGEETKTGVA